MCNGAGLFSWREWCLGQARTQALAAKIGKRLMNRTISAAFDCWDAFREESVARKARMQGLVVRMKNSTLFAAYERWYGEAHEIARREALVRRIRKRWRMSGAVTAYAGWAWLTGRSWMTHVSDIYCAVATVMRIAHYRCAFEH